MDSFTFRNFLKNRWKTKKMYAYCLSSHLLSAPVCLFSLCLSKACSYKVYSKKAVTSMRNIPVTKPHENCKDS